MKLSSKTIYALQAMVEIAQSSAEGVPGAEIAKQQKIPVKFLEQILAILKRGRLVKSSRGRKGGYTLGLPAREISVYDVIEKIEGPITLTAGIKRGGPIFNVLKEGEEKAVAELKKRMIEDLLTEKIKKEGIFIYNI